MPLDIAQLGQPVLRQVAAEVPIEKISDPEFQEFLGAMLETLEANKGAGLAAPQVFVGLRVFLAAIIPAEVEDDPPGVVAFINPTITPLSEEKTTAWEGCLSFPELLVRVPRHNACASTILTSTGSRRPWNWMISPPASCSMNSITSKAS